ncbi:MAG: DevR family CRISPR-associated autoregulator [Candidatus Micrarchaeota archaeon]|nr:DevR family CRISPR-associated autoregulator [Candidatus Micrarchaeota archaeon]
MARNKSKKAEEVGKSEKILYLLNWNDLEERSGGVFTASGKRAVLTAIYYSFPSNQNASGSSGSNVISQKIIPWGDDAEPRVYVSPYALKRRIRDYWIKKYVDKSQDGNWDVLLREDRELSKENKAEITSSGKSESNSSEKMTEAEVFKKYIDADLFGFMLAGKSSNEAAKFVKPGPITTWGAVSLESLRTFVDFNTNLINVSEKEGGEKSEGGSLINRSISKEFYFTSFFINPDLIGYIGKDSLDTELRKKRLAMFFEAVDYAMQKDVGGARDRPACVFKLLEIRDYAYGKSDKILFKNIRVSNDKIYINSNLKLDTNGASYYIHYDSNFVELSEDSNINNWNIEEILDLLIKNKTNY